MSKSYLLKESFGLSCWSVIERCIVETEMCTDLIYIQNDEKTLSILTVIFKARPKEAKMS